MVPHRGPVRWEAMDLSRLRERASGRWRSVGAAGRAGRGCLTAVAGPKRDAESGRAGYHGGAGQAAPVLEGPNRRGGRGGAGNIFHKLIPLLSFISNPGEATTQQRMGQRCVGVLPSACCERADYCAARRASLSVGTRSRPTSLVNLLGRCGNLGMSRMEAAPGR